MPIAALLARIERLVAHVAALGAENAALKVRVGMLEAENAALKADNAALREKLGRPPKTPDNSGIPPSQGAQGERCDRGEAQGQGPRGGAPPAASRADPAARRVRGALPALPGGAGGGEPGPAPGLRPD